MEVEVERPVHKVQRLKKKNGGSAPEVIPLQAEKLRQRPTWQKEKTKASRELHLQRMRETFNRQRSKEVQRDVHRQDRTKQKKEKTLMNGHLYCDVTELQNIIRQTAKERLHLERHLVKTAEIIRRNCEVDVTQYKSLRESNHYLRQKVEELQDADTRLGERELELQQLRDELKSRQELCIDLEQQLRVTIEKQEEAERHSLELEQQLQELQPITVECSELRESLASVENRYNLAKSEVNSLQGKVSSLEALVKHMRDAADKRKELERQHSEAVAELQKRQEEVRHLHITNKAEKQQALETIQNLESKVRELQKKCELQNVLYEELVLEMTALRRSQSKQAWRTQRSHSAEAANEPSQLDKEMDLYLVGSDTVFSSNRNKKSQSLSVSLPALDTGTSLCTSPYEPFSSSGPATSPGVKKIVTISEPKVTATTTFTTTTTKPSADSSKTSTASSHEIDRIMARIEQDNQILAELEKSRATVGSPVSMANLERLRAQLEEEHKQVTQMTRRPNLKSSVTMKELDVLMAKLEQDNKILAELDKKRATIGSSAFTSSTGQSVYTTGRRPYSATPPGSRSSTPLTGASSVPALTGATTHGTSSYSSTLPSLPAGAPYSSSRPASRREEDIYADVDYIDLPHRGRCKVFIARYSYDPLKQSPNENPEAELCLKAGDYVLIFGDMDEDGFFSGELLDGKKGLVPSNFVEKLTGEDLFEFQSQVLYGTRDSDDSSASVTYGDDDEMHPVSKVTAEDFHRMNDYIDLEDIEELDEDDLSDLEREEGPVPHPQRLILERQLNKSILIGWMPPDAPRGAVEAYHVYVDGVPKATIRASEKTRALVEGVDSSQPHRISVRSVSPAGRHSRDAACTIVIGKDIPLAPVCVKASNITSTSAVISWLPSNSNFQHVVAINSVEVKTLKPGTFRHMITGLAPSTTYKVSVRARPARLFINHENPRKLGMLTATVEFRTHPKGWLPDPPVDVQVEPGPQDGTLLVTWLPVTINTKGTSNGAPVTGYVVYTGDRKVGEINSPTGDHALLDLNHIAPLKKRTLTVRTKSGDNLSSESMPCVIPVDLLKNVAATMIDSEVTNEPSVANGEGERDRKEQPPRERKKSTGSTDSESDTELAELLKHVTRRSEAFNPAENPKYDQQGTRAEDLIEEGIRSELSDIAEEPEDDTMRSSDQRAERRGHHHHHHPKDTSLTTRDQDRKKERRETYVDDTYSEIRRDRRDDHRTDRRDVRTDRHDDYRHDDYRRDDRRDIRHEDIRRDERRDARRDDHRIDRRDDMRGDWHDNHYYDRRDHYDRRDMDTTRTTKHYPSDHRSPDRSHGRMSPTGMHREHSPRDRPYGISNRRLNSIGIERRNSAGQVIIEPEENLSDKEIYPQSQHVIPSIEITRDNEVTNSEDEYLRGTHRGYYADSRRGESESQYYSDRSRPRPTSPTPPSRHYRDQENSYYGHRGHSRAPRDDYYNNGYHRRGSPRSRSSGERTRLFVALYDYDPHTMSPNPDAAEDELTFQEGQVIKVYGEKDADGFYRGELNGRFGYVPCNMVSEIRPEDEEAHKHMMNENVSSHHRHSGDPSDPWSTLPVRKLVALYDYDPQELSPNVDAEMELAFKTGDVIYVYGSVDEDGFYMGELNGVRGLVPSNFLTEAPPDFRDPKSGSLQPPARYSSGTHSYAKDHRDDSRYVRDSHSAAYSSSATAKDQSSHDKGHKYSERATEDRTGYDRSRGRTSEAERGHYSSSGHSGQHW